MGGDSVNSPASLSEDEDGSSLEQSQQSGTSIFDADHHQPYQRRAQAVYSEIFRSYDDLRVSTHKLRDAKAKILRYKPGAWIEMVGGTNIRDYDVPKTTSLLLIGSTGSGKSSLINQISKVFEDEEFAPERAQVSYNSSFGDGTYFLQEYMIPTGSTSFCLYDTRSLSDDFFENIRTLRNWMMGGVRHGELIIRDSDSSSLRTRMKCKARQNSHLSSKKRMVNFVVFVVNGLSVLKSMGSDDEAAVQHTKMIAKIFNCPYLSFKDDKPAVAVTHGDLLSVSDRTRIRVHLGDLLGIPPAKQIFDIPAVADWCNPVTELAVVEMVRYSLEHADRNLPHINWRKQKVCWASLQGVIFVMIVLGIAIIAALTCHAKPYFGPILEPEGKPYFGPIPEPEAKPYFGPMPEPGPHIDWHTIRHLWI